MARKSLTVKDLEKVLDASRLLSSQLELDQLLTTIMDMAREVMEVEASSVLLLDEIRQELYFDVAVGGSGDRLKGVRFPVGQGIAGKAAKTGKSMIVNNVGAHPEWRGDYNISNSAFVTRAILACPLMVKGKVIGVVEAINRPENQEFTALDAKLFEAFASQAAVAIDNARMFSNLTVEKEKIETLFKQMADGSMLVDESGRILSFNRRASDWFRDVKVKHITDFDAQGFIWDPQPEGLLNSPATHGSLEIRRIRPKLFILAGTWGKIIPSHGGGSLYLFLFRDVTDVQHEAILQRNFLSMISHKLRTPLVAITGYMPLIKRDWERLNETQQKSIEAIDREGRHLNYLVEDLIRFTTVAGSSSEFKIAKNKTTLGRIIDDTLFKLDLLVSTMKVEIEKNVDPAAELVGDTSLLIDMTKSLIENAIQFNTRKDKRLTLVASRQNGNVELSIVDNGPGIPAEEREKVFRWFYQIDEDFTGQIHGMGLGLAFVKKVVDLHRGRIDLESTVGQGSTFKITLPSNL